MQALPESAASGRRSAGAWNGTGTRTRCLSPVFLGACPRFSRFSAGLKTRCLPPVFLHSCRKRHLVALYGLEH